ncbi:MAG: CDP-alcohol phosphatidyltransferase family protein [Proteobacteria bacterium]|nr:CDP-alcohol phosphatidyltransferase family protein [Pseudomonadota bacterium]
MLSSKLGHFLDKPLAPIVKFININPNYYTFLGLLLNLFAAYVVIEDFFMGGILLGFASIFDMLDGISARINGKATKFGAFLDSLLDRISEGVFLLGMAINFALSVDLFGALITIVVLILSYLISYIRARAEGLGIECKVGLIERPERIILLLIGLIFGYLKYLLVVLAILSLITIVQRFLWVYEKARSL